MPDGSESVAPSVAPSISPSVRAMLPVASPPLFFLQLRVSESNTHCLNQAEVDDYNAQVSSTVVVVAPYARMQVF